MNSIELARETQAAMMRGIDPNCSLREETRRAAHRLSYDEVVEDTLLRGAGMVYMADYDPTTIQAPVKAYYAPHRIGKPEGFEVTWSEPNELFQGWFNETPIDDSK